MTQATSPSPLLFLETAFAIQRTCSIRAAVDLEVFTAIKEGHDTTPALADRCNASERGMRMLVDYLVMLGFLTKSGNTYALTQDSGVFLGQNFSGLSRRDAGVPPQSDAVQRLLPPHRGRPERRDGDG